VGAGNATDPIPSGGEEADVVARRSELVSTIAHELKNPVMSIKGLAATGLRLYDSMTIDEHKEFFRLIDQEAARLELIAEEMSTAMKIDAGVLRYDLRPEDLGALVEAEVWRAPLGEHPLTVEAATGITVRCDRLRIAEAVRHGVVNAASFSPPDAPIEVRVAEEGPTAVIDIADRGPGVAPGDRDRVFERFASVRPPGYEEVQGAGLGLHIARAHVLAHGGRISLLDGPEGGTILRIELPTEE
jgi:signal transduction histidine kinase